MIPRLIEPSRWRGGRCGAHLSALAAGFRKPLSGLRLRISCASHLSHFPLPLKSPLIRVDGLGGAFDSRPSGVRRKV